MKTFFLILAAVAGLAFLPSVAKAQERLGDGAMGALAGALVGGPVGLVAGGIVGYTAGPSIASSWGLKGHRHSHHAHYRRHQPHREAAKTNALKSGAAKSASRSNESI